jgi:hypothetical protein
MSFQERENRYTVKFLATAVTRENDGWFSTSIKHDRSVAMSGTWLLQHLYVADTDGTVQRTPKIDCTDLAEC